MTVLPDVRTPPMPDLDPAHGVLARRQLVQYSTPRIVPPAPIVSTRERTYTPSLAVRLDGFRHRLEAVDPHLATELQELLDILAALVNR